MYNLNSQFSLLSNNLNFEPKKPKFQTQNHLPSVKIEIWLSKTEKKKTFFEKE